jgi:P pilus assembly chaperone PapD
MRLLHPLLPQALFQSVGKHPVQHASAMLRYMLLICVCAFWPVHDALADLMLHPTRVVFERNVRAAQIDLINKGTETATYRISLINRRMDDLGRFSAVDVPQPDEAFADSMVRYSPRQVTLAPGAAQTVRILLRKPPELAAGEYRSHLLFQRVAEDPRGDSKGGEAQSDGVEIKLRALVSVSIPVIVRHGQTTATAEVGELAVKKGPSGEPILAVELRRSGNRSLYGDVIVTFTPQGGAEVAVGRGNGVAVYTPNALRRAQLVLQPSPGTELARGTLRVSYRERPQDGGKLLAERTLQLP